MGFPHIQMYSCAVVASVAALEKGVDFAEYCQYSFNLQ